MAVIALPLIGFRYAYDGLIAIGYGLMLPTIAVLHVRHSAVRSSGAMLGTIAGTATVGVGLVAAIALDLRPAALIVLGIWWWTIGKMWVETDVMSRSLGFVTAALGVLAFVAAALLALLADLLVPGATAGQAWTVVHAVVGLWLIALAGLVLTTRG